MPGLLRALLLVTALLASAPLASAQTHSDETVMVLIKFMPEEGRAADGAVRFEAASCPACTQAHDPAFERFNTRESILQMEVPRARALELAFDIAPAMARRVIVNDTDMPAHRENGRLIVALPPLYEDAPWAPALDTDIVEPGMVLRVEHADPARRAGAYAEGRFPALERRAADNLSFAQREVVRRLGLGEYVAREGIGLIMVMGFDTNLPAGHTDAPPHVHMHMRWPNNVGSQISHYYIDDRGLLYQNSVGVRALGAPQRLFGLGETFTTVDNRGRPVYAHTITAEGHLRIDRPDGASCLLSPIGNGFQSGVMVACGGLGHTTVVVENTYGTGVIIVQTGDVLERFRYDPDTGSLLTPITPPPPPASARNP